MPPMIRNLLLTLFCLACSAPAVTLTFEGIGDATPVDDFYSGLGIVFDGATAFVDADDGGTGDFGSEPSPGTAAFTEFGMVISVPAGIVGSVTFRYSNPGGTTNVRTYAEPDAGGPFLNDEYFTFTALNGAPDPTGAFSPFETASFSFTGVRRSLQVFSRGPGGLFIDDLTVTVVPEPSTFALAAGALAVWALRRSWRRLGGGLTKRHRPRLAVRSV